MGICVVFLILLLFLIAPKLCKLLSRERGGGRFRSFIRYMVIVLGGIFIAMLAMSAISELTIPPDEREYALDSRAEVISVNCNESVPAANFIYDGQNYWYIPKDGWVEPQFKPVAAEDTHINHTDGPAYIERYRVVGFKHVLTKIYGMPIGCCFHYEIYAPENTIQNITQFASQE